MIARTTRHDRSVAWRGLIRHDRRMTRRRPYLVRTNAVAFTLPQLIVVGVALIAAVIGLVLVIDGTALGAVLVGLGGATVTRVVFVARSQSSGPAEK